MESFDALVIFVKVPEPGRVKSRLGQKIGFQKAAQLYGLFLQYLSWQFRELPPGLRLWIAVSPPRSHPKILKFLPYSKKAALFGQKGKDLGERLMHATRTAQKAGAGKVLLIGSDCLEINRNHLRKACSLLGKKELVLGPAKDGGYYLIGWKEPLPACLKGVAWSTAKVLKQTIRNARRKGYSIGLLPALADVDRWEDLRRLASRLDARNPVQKRILRFLDGFFRI
jgi:rSAM/selenodomain-associated transferase 1